MLPLFVSLGELEALAKEKLSANAFQYYRSGANGENTLKNNISAFTSIKLHPRILRNVANVDLKTKILGHQISMPFGFAPIAMLKLATPEGETIPASVAYERGIPYTLSTLSTTSIPEVAKANNKGLRFMQLYIQKDRELTKFLIKQAEANGFSALVLTVDAPILGKREADERQKFMLPPNLNLEILDGIAKENKMTLQRVENKEGSGLLKYFSDQIDPTLTWETISWLRQLTRLPIVLKGIQSWEDALLAKENGVDAVWVSNHGARQLDTVRASIDILPEVVQVLKHSKVEIYIDGGIRYGSDIFKCLALGANHVFLGRPVIFSTTVGQKLGVERLVDILQNELVSTMQLSGVNRIQDITQAYIVKDTIPKPNF